MNLIQIENRKGKLRLNDGVHKESADKLIEELDRLYGPAAVLVNMKIGDVFCAADDALEAVEIEINSPGGSVFEGQRIYNSLREMSARGVEISTTVNGLAASMGSLILMAGDKRAMTQGSRIMIHEASTIAWGDARVLRKNAEVLESVSAEIAGVYADRTGGDKDDIRNLMYAETWMDTETAKANGFIHAIIKDGRKSDAENCLVDIREAKPKPPGMSLLAKLFPGNDEVSKLEASIAENDTLRADLTAAQARIIELTALSEANATLQGEVTALTTKLTDAESALVTATADLAEKDKAIAAAKESAGAEATQILAAIGQPDPLPIETKPDDEIKNLTGFAKVSAFFAKKK